MDEIAIKEWLDSMVDKVTDLRADALFNNQVRVSISESILFPDGIDIAANAIGAELVETVKVDSIYKYGYEFVYRGIKFYTYEKERLPGFKEAEEC